MRSSVVPLVALCTLAAAVDPLTELCDHTTNTTCVVNTSKIFPPTQTHWPQPNKPAVKFYNSSLRLDVAHDVTIGCDSPCNDTTVFTQLKKEDCACNLTFAFASGIALRSGSTLVAGALRLISTKKDAVVEIEPYARVDATGMGRCIDQYEVGTPPQKCSATECYGAGHGGYGGTCGGAAAE